eukprot:s6530_g4.t1
MLLFLYAKGVLRRKHGQTEEPVRALLLPDDNDEQSKQRMRRLVLEKSAGQSQLAGGEYFFFWQDWNPSCLEMLGKGNWMEGYLTGWRVTYALDEGPPPGRVLKLGDHGEEEAFAKEFPLLTAQVFWTGVVRLTFSAETPFGKEAETVGLIQERVFLAKDWLEAGSNSRAAYRFLVYVLVASSAFG